MFKVFINKGYAHEKLVKSFSTPNEAITEARKHTGRGIVEVWADTRPTPIYQNLG